MEEAVREAGGIPATIGVLDGAIRVGVTREELRALRRERRGSSARATWPPAQLPATSGRRPSAACSRWRASWASGSWARAASAECIAAIPSPPDVSADLVALVQAPVLVACSGAKSLLDIPATTE